MRVLGCIKKSGKKSIGKKVQQGHIRKCSKWLGRLFPIVNINFMQKIDIIKAFLGM